MQCKSALAKSAGIFKRIGIAERCEMKAALQLMPSRAKLGIVR